VGREGRAECVVGVKSVQYMVVASSRPRLPCCSRNETPRKIPKAWKARVRAVEALSQSIDIPRSLFLRGSIWYRACQHRSSHGPRDIDLLTTRSGPTPNFDSS
jgi:hypothetical protein